MNRATIRANVRSNVGDNPASYYSDSELNTSIQEAYNIIVALTSCIIKSVTLNWISQKNYYDFKNLGVTDYMGALAIFNINTNMWLRDDLSLRDFDRLRRDWETWSGQPMFWTPHSRQYVAIAPKLTAATGQFTLWYLAKAPIMTQDSDVPLVASDMQTLFEHFCTADMLESAKENTKALMFWEKFLRNYPTYAERCLNIAKADLLLRI